MSRIAIPTREDAPQEAQEILGNVEKLLGFTPNLHRLMSNSPAVLSGWLGLMSALSKTLDVKTRDVIALAVSSVNKCDYCIAAHSHVAAEFAKMTAQEIADALEGKSQDAKRAAAGAFAKAVVEARGQVSDADVQAVREAGYSDKEVVEIVALVAQYSMTNLLNNVAATETDFPALSSSKIAA